MCPSLMNTNDKVLKCTVSVQNYCVFLFCFFVFLGMEEANENVFWRHLASRKMDRAQFYSPFVCPDIEL